MSRKLEFFLVFLAFLVIVSFISAPSQVQAEGAQELAQLKEANEELQNAFGAVLEAEQTGAAVEVLLENLKVGANLMTQAEISHKKGDITEAISKAENVLEVMIQIEAEAIRLRDLELINSRGSFYLTAAISFVGGFSYVLALFLIWKRFKQYYLKRFPTSKFEVKTGET